LRDQGASELMGGCGLVCYANKGPEGC
jgi:hypothetical protein